ncbi:hypothetical protein [Collimonas antrihumi]|uniref:hypothetical protein n=1 Tax=Collimonas antrihumi TaxID=1940615 RepID=UPI001B8CCB99|nr:hypothetical protein [Collimonas antrihumi]
MDISMSRLQCASKVTRSIFLASLFGGAFVLDYVTGYEVTVFGLYVVPVVFAFWLFGRWVSIAMIPVALLCWTIANCGTGSTDITTFNFILKLVDRSMLLLFVVAAVMQTQRIKDVNNQRLLKELKDLSLCTDCHSLSSDRSTSAYIQHLLEQTNGIKFNGRLCLHCLKSQIESNENLLKRNQKI